LSRSGTFEVERRIDVVQHEVLREETRKPVELPGSQRKQMLVDQPPDYGLVAKPRTYDGNHLAISFPKRAVISRPCRIVERDAGNSTAL
jgi:hypothetical protein